MRFFYAFLTAVLAVFATPSSLCAQQTGWALLHEKTFAEWEGLPSGIVEKLEGMRKKGSAVDMHSIAFMHNAMGWMMLYHSGDPKSVVSYNKSWEQVPVDLRDQVQALCDKKIHIRQVVFFEHGGWLILYGKNECLWKWVPEGLADKIMTLYADARIIECITTTRQGGWLLLGENNEFYAENMPEDLLAQLQALKNEQKNIRHIACHANDGWTVLYDKNQVAHLNIPESLSKRIAELQKQDLRIKSISFWSLPKLSLD